MQPVNFISSVEHTIGCVGYSSLVYSLDGRTIGRTTILFLRDKDGWTRNVVIAPAATLREVIY